MTSSQWEPGLDRHEWESQYQQLEDELETAPREALPELRDLIEQMLVERGYDLTDPVARQGEEREVVSEFQAASDTARRVEAGDDDVGHGDVGAAINGLRAIFDYVTAEHYAP
jgi:hypothetical protein